jgi:hypothetical protein
MKHDSRFNEQGVAEGSSDTIYPNAEVIKSKNGKPVGEIYQDGNSWGAFHYRADRGYDLIDSREEAIEALRELHQETGRSGLDYTIKGVAEGAEEAEKYRAQLLKTAPRIMDFLAKAVKGWRPSEQEMLGAIDTAYTVMKHTGDVKQAGKAMVDELNTLHRMSQGQSGMTENFADGRNPQDKGDAKRHGINTKASVSSLRKTAKQGGRKGQLAHWLANMKSGRNKNK